MPARRQTGETNAGRAEREADKGGDEGEFYRQRPVQGLLIMSALPRAAITGSPVTAIP
jgi:hypothetical protein